MVGVFMHPTAATSMLPLPIALARMGLHCCVASSRYPNNDSHLYAEKVVQDLGHFIHHLRDRAGYQRVILFGWSGGGALAALYQSQAENPTITQTPTGQPISMEGLRPADLLVLVAAHCGWASFLTESLDPTIYGCQRQEEDAARTELQALRIYGEGATPAPFSEEFLRRYRAAQWERSQRITSWARSVAPETPMIIEGTMADPRWLDANMDPNERPRVGHCFLGECESANNMPTGLARFTTAGSWLSQWAEGVSELDAMKHLPHTHVPTLIITNGADDGVPASHGPRMFEAIPHPQKKHTTIAKATHYYIRGNPPSVQKRQLLECVSLITQFIDEYTSISVSQLQEEYSDPHRAPGQVPTTITNVTSDRALRGLPPAPRAQGFNHVAMVCSDMAATVRFYTGILGFRLVKTLELPDGGQHFFLDCGDPQGGMIAFFWWPDVAKKRAPGVANASKKDMDRGKIPRSVPGSVNHIAFTYPEEHMDALRERLLAAGLQVSPKLYHADNEIGFAGSREDPTVIAISMYLWGPDGEMIEFSACTDSMFPPPAGQRVLHSPAFVPLSKL